MRYWGAMREKMRRRSRAALAGAGAVVLAALYGSLVETRLLGVTTVSFRGGALSQALAGRRLALLGDLHFVGSGASTSDRVLDALSAVKPDMILLTGDFVRWNARGEAYDQAIAFLSRLRAPLGVYAVTGDADRTFPRKSCELCHEPGSGEPSRRHGVVFLKDAVARVRTDGGEIVVAGIDAETADTPTAAARRLTGGEHPVILLSHSSTVYGAVDPSREVLVLSGDTHGGQVRLPGWFWRSVGRKPDPDHLHGVWRDGKKALCVTRGIGTSWPHLRIGEPPEIVVLEFRR